MRGDASRQLLGKPGMARYHARGSVRCVVEGMGARTSMTMDAHISQGCDAASQLVLRIGARFNGVIQGDDLDGRPTRRILAVRHALRRAEPRRRTIRRCSCMTPSLAGAF